MSNNYKEYASKEELEAVDKVFTGATSAADGVNGLVPAPAKGNQSKYLKADGTWGTPTNTIYTHPTTAGNKHIPAGGASGNILKWSADGTAEWGTDKCVINAYVNENATDPSETVVSDDINLRDGFDLLYQLYETYGKEIYLSIDDGRYILPLIQYCKSDATCIFACFYNTTEQIDSGSDDVSNNIMTITCQKEAWHCNYFSTCSGKSFSDLDSYVRDTMTQKLDQKLNKSGDTMTGALIAQANTNYTTYQVRNIAFSTSASVPTGNGSILGVYS